MLWKYDTFTVAKFENSGKIAVYSSSAFAGALCKKISKKPNPKYEQIRNTIKLTKYEHTWKNFALEELPNSSKTEDMRKIR